MTTEELQAKILALEAENAALWQVINGVTDWYKEHVKK
jgi:hypothetical protein